MNYLQTIKSMATNKEKRVENLILLVVLLVILLVAIKFIFSDKEEDKTNTSNSTGINENIDSSKNKSTNDVQNSLETKLGNILSQIAGISDVSVVLSYSQDSKQNPIFNTKESEKSGEKTTEKSVAYNEQSGSKTALIESIEMPKVEGAIVVAKGASTVEMRSKIATAISTVTNIAVYKVQVFEKQG